MCADIFVYLDTVQFSKNGVQNRNQIRTPQGPKWLTVAVRHDLGQSIRETVIADPQATQKHWKTLQANYGRTPGFQRWKDELYELLHQDRPTLADLAIASTEWMFEKLGIVSRRLRSAEIPGAAGHASALVASICNSLKADQYLTGTGGLSYMNLDDFRRIGCEVRVQRWRNFSYQQSPPNTDFMPDLSTLDLLLNCPDTAAELIAAAGSWEPLESQ